MKGIVLAGGSGTRLQPATLAMNKQLLPIYDKPMIYYPLSLLMLAGIREILIVSSPDYLDHYRRLFDRGEALGLDIAYAVQPRPDGLARAFAIGAEFLGGQPCALVLGDNLLFGAGLGDVLQAARRRTQGATIFACQVDRPHDYGIVELDAGGRPLSLEEKPARPRSDQAVIGLYFYDGLATELAGRLRPSARGEYEITDLNRLYLESGRLSVEMLGRGFTWLDAGTHDSLLDASEFVRVVQKRQNTRIACLEEIAFRSGFIDRATLHAGARRIEGSAYGRYLMQLAESA